MFLLQRLRPWNLACFLLLLACCGSRLVAQAKPADGGPRDTTITTALRNVIRAQEDTVRACERLLRTSEEKKAAAQTLFETAQKNRKSAKASREEVTLSGPPDSEAVEFAVDRATVADADELAKMKGLAAAVAAVDAHRLDRDEVAAQLTATLAHLKSVEHPGGEAQEALQAANQRAAVARLKAARAAQKAAELKSEAADAERAVAQTELTIAKRHVEKAKKEVDEISRQAGHRA